MWGHLRESVQAHATNIVRDISDRLSTSEQDRNRNLQSSHKNAMKNVVTPNSIPQFTLPPLLTYDASEEELESGDGSNDSKKQDAHSQTQARMDDSLKPLTVYNKDQNCHSLSSKRSKNLQKLDQEQNQPGLALQHLLSTKSGFSTLTESPNTRRKESLFLSPSPSYHMTEIGSLPMSGSVDAIGISSSDSDLSRTVSPSSSPLIERLKQKRLFGRSALDSDSNSSCHSSPVQHRKISGKAFHDNSTCATENIVPTEQSAFTGKGIGKNESDGKTVKRSRSASNVFAKSTAARALYSTEVDHSKSPRIHIILTYLQTQQKLNVSILEGENFVDERLQGYLKVSLLPRSYGSFRSDLFPLSTSRIDIKERFSFDAVGIDDICHVSLEISCKEKSGGLRQSKKTLGAIVVPLSDYRLTDSNDIWLDLKPSELEDLPHIQLSLCYHAMLGFVTVEVIAVRNVPKGTLGRYQDCYVVLTEEPSVEKSSKKQTKISHRDKDPVFEESFIISMSNDQLVIMATLFVKDRVKGIWIPFGFVKLGDGVDNWSGQLQWSQALAREGQPVVYWHLLRAP
uniref:Synaptotagmin-7 n=1 Tax=Phallusia mammillata TaxID=59560 RepID=A0A6F9DUE8_9ASCI|nr:synaptotagmin-7 [Phallusia mammillata]